MNSSRSKGKHCEQSYLEEKGLVDNTMKIGRYVQRPSHFYAVLAVNHSVTLLDYSE